MRNTKERKKNTGNDVMPTDAELQKQICILGY